VDTFVKSSKINSGKPYDFPKNLWVKILYDCGEEVQPYTRVPWISVDHNVEVI
jgi:hypothetical protein